MLETMGEAYKVLHLQGQRLSPFDSYYMMTLGNARALGLEDRIGSLHAGADADIVVLDSRAKPAMELRMRTATTLAEELFILQTMGDDRSVAEVYVAGKPMKSRTGQAGLYTCPHTAGSRIADSLTIRWERNAPSLCLPIVRRVFDPPSPSSVHRRFGG